MTIKSQKLTNGTLTIGEVASSIEWGGQVRAVTLTPEYEQDDPIHVLSGEELAGDETKTETLAGTVLDDYSSIGSIFLFSKENEGAELPFTWTPIGSGGIAVTGILKMRQIAIGGDVNTRTENDFEFPIIGDTVAAPAP